MMVLAKDYFKINIFNLDKLLFYHTAKSYLIFCHQQFKRIQKSNLIWQLYLSIKNLVTFFLHKYIFYYYMHSLIDFALFISHWDSKNHFLNSKFLTVFIIPFNFSY